MTIKEVSGKYGVLQNTLGRLDKKIGSYDEHMLPSTRELVDNEKK